MFVLPELRRMTLCHGDLNFGRCTRHRSQFSDTFPATTTAQAATRLRREGCSIRQVASHGPTVPTRPCRGQPVRVSSGQGRVEHAFFRYTSIIGDGLCARSSAGQGSEAVLGCEILK